MTGGADRSVTSVAVTGVERAGVTGEGESAGVTGEEESAGVTGEGESRH